MLKNYAGQTVIFFHIPKTGGQTLSTIIEHQYRPDAIFKTDPERHWESLKQLKQLPEMERRKFKAIVGHMNFGVHEFLPQPSTYITVLRDPVDRIVSYYYYVLQYSGHYLHDTVTLHHMSLKDFISNEISLELDNFQTRVLSGKEKGGSTIPFGQCNAETLECAKQDLRDYFGVVGLVEKFDETIVLMQKILGWKTPFYVKRNVTRNRPTKEDVSKDTLKVIEKHSELDIELYRYAKGLFEELIQQQSPSFNREVTKFKSKNNLYYYLYPTVRRVKHVLGDRL